MKLEYHIKLSDLNIKKLLATVLSLQIALWAVMGLDAQGFSIPLVQPLLGSIYLMFVPGILILTALRLRSLDIVEIALYTVGLSVASVLSIGLVANIVFNALNIIKPFSFLAVTSSVSFVVLLLCIIAYFRNITHYRYAAGSGQRLTNPKPFLTAEISAPLAPTLFLCTLPFIAVFSTYLVNTYNVDAAQLLLWLLLCVVVLLIAFDKFIPSQLYPLAIFAIALTLLFQLTLISSWLTGADIQNEWFLANTVLKTGVWNPTLLGQYNGMLSVVALAPIYSRISSLDLVWVFKLVYPVIFALVPVGLYQICRRQLNDKVAFLSCFFFMSFAPFYAALTTLARQEVAELFFVLLILLLVSEEMDRRIQSALFIVFGLSLVVSHYGLFFIAIFFLFVTWLVLSVARISGPKLTLPRVRTTIGVRTDKQITTSSPKPPPPRSLVTIVSLSILFIASTAWYFYTAQGTITQQIVTLGSHIAGSLGDLFSPTKSQAVAAVQKGPLSGGPLSGILHRINAYVNYLNVFFLLAGVCLAVFLKKQRFKLQFSYIILSTVALGFLIASIAVPYLGAALNFDRTFQITLIVLAPFLAIGFITIGETAGVTLRKVTSKLGFSNSALVSRSRVTKLLAIYLVLFMLLSTGFLFALTEGYQNIALSNQVDGTFSHQTLVGAAWQVANIGTVPLSGKSITIYRYISGQLVNETTKTTDSNGQITYNHTFNYAASYPYYATFAGDAAYEPSTSGPVYVFVGGSQATSHATNQATSQAFTNEGNVTQTLTLSASNTTPAVGQPVTFTVTLTGRPVVSEDYYNNYILVNSLGSQAQIYGWLTNGTVSGGNVFLGTYNLKNGQALILNSTGAGVNTQPYYANVTDLIVNRSLIYSNGGASVYS